MQSILPQWPPTANGFVLFGLLILAGLVGGRLAQRTGFLPRITGFIAMGVVLGPGVSGIISPGMLEGAQVFVDHRGWLQLGPVEAADLHARLREAIDAAAFKWLIEHVLLDQCEPLRSRCNRPIDDEVALRQMADAAALIHPEAEPSDA